MTRGLGVGLVLSLALAGCSALGLDEFTLVRCDGEPSPCDALNAELPADACRYVCSTNGLGCELPVREPERCDGIDNDCDGKIDEETVPGGDVLKASTVPDVRSQVSHSVSSDGTLYVALTHEGTVQGTFGTSTFTLDDRLSASGQLDTGTCERPDTTGEICNFAQLAFAATPELLVGVGIHRAQCNAGQVRVGLGSTANFTFQLGTPAMKSNVPFGIDVDSNSCTRSGPCPGARDPQLALLPAANAASDQQGLAVWLAPGGNCLQSSDTSVVALGLFVTGQDAASAMLMGTSDGHAEVLGPSVGGSAPALVAFATTGSAGGYFVAYPGEQQIALRFVPQLAAPSSTVDAEVLSGTLEADRADHVALAIDSEPATAPRGLAVAYRSGDAATPVIALAALRFDRDHTPHLTASAAPITFQAEHGLVAGPFLAFSPVGFRSTAPAGGWLLAWVEGTDDPQTPQRLMAARVAETDVGTALAPRAPVELARGAITDAFTYLKQVPGASPTLHYGYITGDKLNIGQFTCAALH